MIDFNNRNLEHMSFGKQDVELFKLHCKKIEEDLSAGKENYFYLGVHLLDMYSCKTYRVKSEEFTSDIWNCSSAYFFAVCEKYFGLDKSQVSRYMNIVSEFGDKLIGFAEQWKPYSYSQLSEMLSLTPEQREEVKPDWTIKRIREYKKELAGESVATSQPKEKVYKIIGELKPSSRVSNVLDSTFHDFPELSKDNLVDFIDKLGDRLFVGYNYDGYGLSFTDKVKLISAMIGFAFDISKSLESKDICSFVNVNAAFLQLKKFGYITYGQ